MVKQPISYRVEKMRLVDPIPADKACLVPTEDGAPMYKAYGTIEINDTLRLKGIPAEAFAYRLGNRSALDWVVDQYRIKTDKRSGITSDPNGYSENERYIVDLVERVVRVSVETVAIVRKLQALPFREE